MPGQLHASQEATAREAGELPPVIADDLFRTAFQRHACAVAVITAPGPDGPIGFTATSLTSLSAEPPSVSFNIAHSSSSWPLVASATHLGVHLLDETQGQLAATFARRGVDRFAPPTRWTPGPHAVPLLEGCLVRLVTTTVAIHHAGDHAIVVARITWADVSRSGGPLIYYRGSFGELLQQ